MKTYEEFINDILDSRGRFACGDEYHERHHINPRCCLGTDDEENLIDLFAREHFEAHRLLALENPDNEKLVYAWWLMAHTKRQDQERYILTPEEYEESKIIFSKIHSEAMSGDNNPTKRNDVRQKMSKSLMGHSVSNDTKEKLRKMFTGRKLQEETVNKIRDWFKEPTHHPMYGKHHSNETKMKLGKQICQCELSGKFMTIWVCAGVATEFTGIDRSSIIKCCRGKLHSAGGYQWKYLYDQICKDGTVIPGVISLGLITEEEALKQLAEQENLKGEE